MLKQLGRYFRERQVNFTNRQLAQTQFCDECGQVCTASCRSDGLRQRLERFKLANYPGVYR